jgi:AcrR family transcriptional regulator
LTCSEEHEATGFVDPVSIVSKSGVLYPDCQRPEFLINFCPNSDRSYGTLYHWENSMFQRVVLYFGGAFYVLLGLVMLFGQGGWFAWTPGVSDTGPANLHFIVDVAFAFLASGALILAGTWSRRRSLVIGGVAWPLLHGLFHVVELFDHGASSGLALVTDLGGVIAPAGMLALATFSFPTTGAGLGAARLYHYFTRKFEARWNYDATYLHELIDLAPGSIDAVNDLRNLAEYRGPAPAALLHGGVLAAVLREDCGPCAQLNLDFMRAEDADPKNLQALLDREFDKADPVSVLGFRYVEAALGGESDSEAMREEIRATHGSEALAALAYAVLHARAYPTLKRIMGHAKVCQDLQVEGRPGDE